MGHDIQTEQPGGTGRLKVPDPVLQDLGALHGSAVGKVEVLFIGPLIATEPRLDQGRGGGPGGSSDRQQMRYRSRHMRKEREMPVSQLLGRGPGLAHRRS